ncbi:dTMP kinase [Parahalioglobus pacificus]|uniref:Thymidylate kinase n=1 Tax=Parahalioglobus pacificus TaxID=930806 RepID=A0A918XGI2_9GAMM|nr:dTMP kinase [Halioglobus pacificus]GHD29786.1 thymidylate kinase [Halioglobus pacificus]
MKGRGLFITVEGGEGVGKSTNLAFIEDTLRARGIDLLVSREPGGTPLAESIRELLLAPREELVDVTAELLLMFAARSQHLNTVILPALSRGQWVLCDRFTDATYAYQCGGRGVSTSLVRQLEDLVQGALRPDCTVLLDAPVSTGMARAQARGDLDRFEQEDLEFFERVRSAYLTMARESSGRYRVIDASASLEQVQIALAQVCDDLVACYPVRQ